MRRTERPLDGLDEDIREHIDLETQDHIDRGMSPQEARRRALVKFGNIALVKEDTAAVWSWIGLEHARQDVRYAVRMLLRRPAYALLSVITLALGIGGVAAVYGVGRGVLFDPLPYKEEEEIGVFWKKTDWTHEEYLFIRGRVPGFRDVALYRRRDVMLRVGDGPTLVVPAVTASAELFEVLGVRPLIGRGFQAGEDRPAADAVALISYAQWQEMGGIPEVIGMRVFLEGRPRTIVGVLPAEFWFPDHAVRIFAPEPLTPESRSWNSTLIGRIAPGHDLRSMGTAVAQLVAMLDERFDYPAQWDKTVDARIMPVRDDLLGPIQPAVLATLAAMALILLIGCANVAALVLGQVDARSIELAVRTALGARRQRLAQQLVIEVLLVAVVAALVGAGVAWAGFTLIAQGLPLGALANSAAPDWRVFSSALGIATIAAALVIVAPVIALYRTDIRAVLNRARTGGVEGRSSRLENTLVIAQVTLAVLITVAAALLVRSVTNLYSVEPGVRTDGVAIVDAVFGIGGRARREQALAELIGALRSLPGVQSAGAAQKLPLRGGGYGLPLDVGGADAAKGMTTEYRVVTPGYLESIGIPLRRGRTITEADRADTERVVVINQAFAETYLPGLDPLGRVIGGDLDNPPRPLRIIGVVADAAETELTDHPPPVRYVALRQLPWMDTTQSLVLRVAPGVDEISLLEPARQLIGRVAPNVAIQQTTTMRRVLDTAVGPARQIVLLLSMMATLALVLGGVGVYGVIAHFAARRRRDWAIRMALGCSGFRVISSVLGHGTCLVGSGIAIGILASAALTRMLASLLYGVDALDAFAFAVAAAALLGVGVVASGVPAWRAGTADPLGSLREQ
jgi:putative ABC transport system permease protein